jgi:hypothetical protein
MMIDRTGNLADIKQRIVSFMKVHGPALPIHISKETKTTLLLASAFLSDLSSEKTIKISSMKVGGSPLYYLPGQESMLENFEKFLNHKERESLNLLKQSKVLRDDEQDPAIRVALRAIKDFAKQYTIKQGDKTTIFWQYASLAEEEANKLISEKLEQIQERPREEVKVEAPAEKPALAEAQVEKEIAKEIEAIKENLAEIETIKEEKPDVKIEPIFNAKPKQKAKAKKKVSQAAKDRFLEEVKSILQSKSISLINVEKYDNKEVTARVRIDNSECLLVAFNKSRANEPDLLKAYKKSLLAGLPYSILCKGEVSKKTKESIEAHKRLANIIS